MCAESESFLLSSIQKRFDEEQVWFRFRHCSFVFLVNVASMAGCNDRYLGCNFESDTAECVQEQLESSQYMKVPCQMCSLRVQKGQMLHHLKNYCQNYYQECPYCSGSVLRMDFQNHVEKCYGLSLTCSFCGEDIYHEKVVVHERTCPQRTISCKMAVIGCSFQGIQENVTKHEQETDHQDLFLKFSMEMFNRIHTLEKEVSLLKASKKRTNELIQHLPLSTFRWTVNNFTSYMWKKDWSEETFSVSSPTFYIGVPGYLAHLVIWPNGHGAGRHLYLSVYMRILKGDYDAECEWPFRHKFLFRLVNHLTPSKHCVYVHGDYASDASCIPYQFSDEINCFAGKQDFVPLEIIEDLSSGYIIHESITIEFEVF